MQIYKQLADLPTPVTPIVATIGNFDGVHLGHQSVIANVIARARELGGQSVAITFDPHPARVLHPDHPLHLITPLPQKLELLAATGIDATVVLPFTDALRHTPPRTFAAEVLANGIHATEIHEGENFRFGFQAEAGIDNLEALGSELGFRVVVYAPLIMRGEAVSSSRIRNLIAAGQVSHARTLLGRPFGIDSTPAPGRGYGTKYAVPTINLAPYADLLPANGVYVTTLRVDTGAAAVTFESVTNAGIRPTFGEPSFAVEAHLLNFRPIPLDEHTPLRLTFLRRLRAEQTFPTPEALRTQIARDVTSAQRYFTLCRRAEHTHP